MVDWMDRHDGHEHPLQYFLSKACKPTHYCVDYTRAIDEKTFVASRLGLDPAITSERVVRGRQAELRKLWPYYAWYLRSASHPLEAGQKGDMVISVHHAEHGGLHDFDNASVILYYSTDSLKATQDSSLGVEDLRSLFERYDGFTSLDDIGPQIIALPSLPEGQVINNDQEFSQRAETLFITDMLAEFHRQYGGLDDTSDIASEFRRVLDHVSVIRMSRLCSKSNRSYMLLLLIAITVATSYVSSETKQPIRTAFRYVIDPNIWRRLL
jgi:hypothetical protein